MRSLTRGLPVDQDVANIEKLTKEDIIEFFNYYIRPGSLTRAKLSVHMQARASTSDSLLSGSAEEQKSALVDLIEQFLGSCEVTADRDSLEQRFEDVATDPLEPDALMSALKEFLTVDVKLDDEKQASIIERGQVLMQQILPKTNTIGKDASQVVPGDTPAEDETSQESSGEQFEGLITIIDDVREFKAGLAVTAGARPVRPLSDFEELNAKL